MNRPSAVQPPCAAPFSRLAYAVHEYLNMQGYRSGHALPVNIIALRLETNAEDVLCALGELADVGVVVHRLGPHGPGFYMADGAPGAT